MSERVTEICGDTRSPRLIGFGTSGWEFGRF